MLFDGEGEEAVGEVAELDRRSARIRIDERRPRQELPPPRVTLAVAVPQGDRWDWLVEKATEAGAAEVWPVLFARGVVRPDPARRERWERIAREACKQCGRSVLPGVPGPVALRDALPRLRALGPLFLGEPGPSARPLPEAFRAAGCPAACSVLVGPEGGLEAWEEDEAASAEAVRVSLGPYVLRTETAALAAVVAVRAAAVGRCAGG